MRYKNRTFFVSAAMTRHQRLTNRHEKSISKKLKKWPMLDLSSPVRLDPSLVSSSRHQCLGVVTVTKAVRRRGPPSRCRPLLITAAKLVMTATTSAVHSSSTSCTWASGPAPPPADTEVLEETDTCTGAAWRSPCHRYLGGARANAILEEPALPLPWGAFDFFGHHAHRSPF
jgi:hypothetical protein